MSKNSVIFRLTTGKKEGTWSIRGGSAKKNGVAKFINYRPGADSIFDDDNKDSIIKPQEVVFRYNDILSDPACEIVVPIENKILIEYLKAHPYYNVHYKVYDEDIIAQESIARFDNIEKALGLIRETDDLKIQAIAIAVFNIQAYGWTPTACQANLKEKALNQPEVIIKCMEAPNYESKYLSALAFFSEIVKENSSLNAVVWNDDTEGPILHLAKGENGIFKLAELLAEDSDQSRLIHQEIAIRVDDKSAKSLSVNQDVVYQDSKETLEALAQKDKENAELRRRLDALESGQGTGSKNPNPDGSTNPAEPLTLVDAQKAYLEKFKTEVPNPKKNNLDWILDKLKG